MHDINRAMIAKLGCQVLSNNNQFWVQVLKAKYLSNRRFMNVQPSIDSTSIWKGILHTRDLLDKGAC